MITPVVAPVRPRIVSPTTGDALLLEDFVLTTAEKTSRGLIHLAGPIGSGKTTALRHLAATVLPHFPVLLLDDPDPAEASLRGMQQLVVYTRADALPSGVSRRIAAWGEDDWIEYLLARHPDQASSVFCRIRNAPDRSLAGGIAELWRIVMDRMARFESIDRIADALLLAVDQGGEELGYRELAATHCEQILHMVSAAARGLEIDPSLMQHDPASIPDGCYLWRLLRFPSIRTLVTAESLAKNLSLKDRKRLLVHRLPRELVEQTAARVRSMPSAMEYLGDLTDHRLAVAPMAASILHATGNGWRPTEENVQLRGAYLSGARWTGLRLADADLRGVDLSEADLRRSVWTNVKSEEANLEAVALAASTIDHCSFYRANVSRANLRSVTGSANSFVECDLRHADFRGCRLPESQFFGAQMGEATFFGADLQHATLVNAKICDADFRNVNFESALLRHLRLREARLEGAVFTNASLQDCDLEDIQWDDARFDGAKMSRAYLTGSVLPRADFRAADLRHAGLGEIIWEGADLRRADLTGCSFHMGSSRCGLVGSPYPSEGTRTGFYTDDYDDQYFKAPEEIRKASLRGANLLGARTDNTDFYLVDLRDAIYDERQRDHFRQTGAILQSRKCE